MTRRPLKIRMTTKPKPEATDPEALANQITDWLLGRTNQVPALYVPRRTTQS